MNNEDGFNRCFAGRCCAGVVLHDGRMRQNFNAKMVQPCQGKKAGDSVTITTRNGQTVQATCTLTAVPNPRP